MWIEKKRAMLQFYPRFQAICYSREEDKKCLLTASFYELSCCIKSFRVALNQLQFFDREPKKLHSQSKFSINKSVAAAGLNLQTNLC